MTDIPTGHDPLLRSLGALGADLTRWPAEQAAVARRRLLADSKFRRAWEKERAFDAALDGARADLDREIALGGAVERVRNCALAWIAAQPLAGASWRRIAAAVLAASVVGGAMDLWLNEPVPEAQEMVLLDPLEPPGAELP